ncbi:MAG TPA: NifU N-terminal domain-containing protein [Hyphomicrobiaceae bacterium]|nr:NifU N-terminal domain-containing protein [Hyphomicrobiaceae bacterium]
MFIQTEATVDPTRLKFLPGCEILAEGTLDLRDKAGAAVSPLAERIFAIAGISGVSLGTDWILVTKADGDWQHLKPAVFGAIMEHFMSDAPILRQSRAAGGQTPSASPAANGGAETLEHIREALRQVIDPELGCNIVDLGLVYDVAMEEGGGVRITMTTTTPGCPATSYLKQGAGEAASGVAGVETVDVELTYDPRWSPEMMSAEAKEQFGISGGGGW